MAEIQSIRDVVSSNCHTAQWDGLAAGDTGARISNPLASDKTLHVFGTFAGNTLIFEGSNVFNPSETDWLPLHDYMGVALSFTSANLVLIAENPIHMRPRITGLGASSISAILVGRNGK
jgi:hypothetical protein